MSNKNFEQLYNQACKLLGKKEGKDGEKFDLNKEITELINNRDFWKKHWGEQRVATGLSFWAGYSMGFLDKSNNIGPRLMSGLRTNSKC